MGAPKTIDNDVGDSEFQLIDHTPGYASTARYWAHMVQFANEENRGSSPADPVLVLQAMGRQDRFHPGGGTAWPIRTDEMPLQIYSGRARSCRWMQTCRQRQRFSSAAHGRAIRGGQ